ncbi:unnamed protein product [Musa acuminata subsp. burmannicoides]
MTNNGSELDPDRNALPPPNPHKSAVTTDKKQKREIESETRPTRYIPIDIVESLLTSMNPKDAMRLSVACKDWRPPPRNLTRPDDVEDPWLITTEFQNLTCSLRAS